MKKNTVSIEENLTIKKSNTKGERKVTIKEEPSTSSDAKLDTLIRKMDRMVDKMSITKMQLETQVQNPNFLGQQHQPQFMIKHREQRAPEQLAQEQIHTPLQQNYAQGFEEEEEIVDEIHFFTKDGHPIFLKEDEE